MVIRTCFPRSIYTDFRSLRVRYDISPILDIGRIAGNPPVNSYVSVVPGPLTDIKVPPKYCDPIIDDQPGDH